MYGASADDRPWPAMTWPIPQVDALSGRVVRLVRVDPDAHAEGLFRALDESRVWTHFGAPRPSAAREAAAGLRLMAADPGRTLWIVIAQDDSLGVAANSVLGMTSYQDVSAHDARLEIGATAYSPAVWGSAVNPEAKLLLLRHAFEELGGARVQFRTDARIERSRRAIAGIGAEYEGTLRRYERRLDGTLRDSVFFGITSERWPEVRRLLEQRVDNHVKPGEPAA
jgi:RimJ/RimL family protein N-acetyltransferase